MFGRLLPYICVGGVALIGLVNLHSWGIEVFVIPALIGEFLSPIMPLWSGIVIGTYLLAFLTVTIVVFPLFLIRVGVALIKKLSRS